MIRSAGAINDLEIGADAAVNGVLITSIGATPPDPDPGDPDPPDPDPLGPGTPKATFVVPALGDFVVPGTRSTFTV